MLDWIFEGIVTWVSSIASELMDAVSRVFLAALGTDMDAMEGYFPFVVKAFDILQYMAWTILFLITVWQLFRVFGGPITEAENPWQLLLRSALFAVLVGAARPIFTIVLDVACAPYTALMEVSMDGEDFTFAGIEEALKKRPDHHRFHGDCGGTHPNSHFAHRFGLELLQALAGVRRALYRGGSPLLYQSPGVCHGRLQDYKPGVQVLVPNGGFPALTPGAQRMVSPSVRQFGGSVHRQRRRLGQWGRICVPLVVLRPGFPQDSPEI